MPTSKEEPGEGRNARLSSDLGLRAHTHVVTGSHDVSVRVLAYFNNSIFLQKGIRFGTEFLKIPMVEINRYAILILNPDYTELHYLE